jgi:hypothetical protein
MAKSGGMAYGKFAGQEKEPPTMNGPKAGGKQPPVHSHSAMPKRKIMPKRGMKRMM